MIKYEDLPFLPWLIGETVCQREYKGQEFRPGTVSSQWIAKYEALRKKMTEAQIRDFGLHVDWKCKAAYEAKAKWFMKIIKAKGNAGRDQLYVWATHWMVAWLGKNK
jgi:hypothetical protein